MNIPQIYLVEPYNAYAPKGKKKHWHQVIEEEALMARVIAEQQHLREAAAKTSHPTLPPQAPPISQATSQAYSGGEGAAGGPNTTGGGGQQPRPQFFNPGTIYTFTATPATSSVPSSVHVSVAGSSDTLALGGAVVAWDWGDGTTGDGGAGASHCFNSTGVFNIVMTVTSPYNNTTLATQTSQVTMSIPTVAAAFTVTGATVIQTAGYYTASVGDTLAFVNEATTNNPHNPLTYNWEFSSGSSAESTDTNPSFVYTVTGSYLVTLGATGSFNTISAGTRRVQIV